MIYARFGPDSSVYVFTAARGLECCCCRLMGGFTQNYTADDSRQMLDHLQRHIDAGHKVPDDCIGRLNADEFIGKPVTDDAGAVVGTVIDAQFISDKTATCPRCGHPQDAHSRHDSGCAFAQCPCTESWK